MSTTPSPLFVIPLTDAELHSLRRLLEHRGSRSVARSVLEQLRNPLELAELASIPAGETA